MPARPSLSRRELLRRAARPRIVLSPEPAAGDVLVVIFLRGAMDGVHTVPPFADPAYQRQRPTLALPEPGKAGGAVDLDGYFGLHPDLAPLGELFQEKRLAVVHACGSPDTTLSHFEAMQTMERGVSDGNSTASGWLSRHLASRETGNSSPMRAVAFGDVLPKSLQGSTQATAVRSLSEFRLAVPDGWPAEYRGLLADLYPGGGDAARTAGSHIFELLGRLNRLKPDDYTPAGGAAYPETDLGRGLKQVAQLIKAEVGLEIASVDLGGWDAHVAQVTLMSGLMQDLGKSLHAFHADLESRMKRVTVVAMTEFGRRVHENSGLGTDHGRGSAMFLLGGGIRGGKVYGHWPGLAKDELDRDGNLRVTTDYRDILGEIVERRLRNPQLDRVFPGWQPRYLGLTA